MPKYQVLENCYGFQDSYWEKGQIVDVAEGIKVPEYFQKLNGNDPERKATPEPKEASTPAEIAHEELLAEAKSRGIKEADLLTQDELLAVLAKDISPQKRTAIIQKAKKRQQK